jgi:hypothetical protein
VEEIGFVPHPVIGSAGCSPDGFVGKEGLVEFKCPQPAQHLATLRGEPIAAKYLCQANFQMACTDRQWVDWVSFCPSFPESMRLFKQRVPRDVDEITRLEKEVEQFLREIERAVDDLSSRYLGTPSKFTVLKDLKASAELAKAS